jgi:hypothetical protein
MCVGRVPRNTGERVRKVGSREEAKEDEKKREIFFPHFLPVFSASALPCPLSFMITS